MQSEAPVLAHANRVSAAALGRAMPFPRRLLLSALLAGLVLVCVAGALAWRQYDDARTSAVNDARTRVTLAGAMIDSYFGGEITTLSSIAESPPVRAGDLGSMRAYFRRIEPPGGGPFGGGLGWIDAGGHLRVSTNQPANDGGIDVAGRSYFRAVMATRRALRQRGHDGALDAPQGHRHGGSDARCAGPGDRRARGSVPRHVARGRGRIDRPRIHGPRGARPRRPRGAGGVRAAAQRRAREAPAAGEGRPAPRRERARRR